jgi:hypothetical protein
MATLIFVHGTGVRDEPPEQSYTATCEIIAGALGTTLPEWKLARCYWGDSHGVRLREGASVPGYAAARSVEAVSDEDEELALWELLYADPGYELRLLAGRGGEAEELPPNQTPAWQRLEQELERFQPSERLRELIAQGHLGAVWGEAFRTVLEDPILSEALLSSGGADADAPPIIARAVVAQAVVFAELQGVPPPGGEVRDALAAQFVQELGASYRSIAGFLVSPLKGLALRLATRKLRRKRGAFSDAASPVAGDILFYQTRGDGLRGFIREQIVKAEAPCALLAHSLGGIACVDLLAREELLVTRLITVGSQAPLLYEMDCLTSLRYGERLRANFPPWLNVYDPNDFLSYLGAQVFPGRVEDFEVRSRQPFPQAHSAYWSLPEFWKKVAEFAA